MFPREIIEHILSFADGQSLLSAAKINSDFKQMVNYVCKKNNKWKELCMNEIPAEDIYALASKYWANGPIPWDIIYQSWLATRSFSTNEIKHILPFSFPGIKCVKVSGFIAAMGCINGSVIFTNDILGDGNYVPFQDYNRTEVKDIVFLNEKKSEINSGFKHTHVMICHKEKLVFYEIEDERYGKLKSLHEIEPAHYYSIYKECLCYLTGNTILVEMMSFDLKRPKSILLRIMANVSIYAPDIVNTLSIFEDRVVFITDSTVRSFNFTDSRRPSVETGRVLPVSSVSVWKYFLFYNKVLFAVGVKYLTLTMVMDESKEYEKRFAYRDIYKCDITTIYLHGHTLIVGTEKGTLYLYSVQDWKNFDLSKCDREIKGCDKSILSIDVQELDDEIRIVICDNTDVLHIFMQRPTNPLI